MLMFINKLSIIKSSEIFDLCDINKCFKTNNLKQLISGYNNQADIAAVLLGVNVVLVK